MSLQLPMPNAQCPMPNPQLPITHPIPIQFPSGVLKEKFEKN
ncbi:MAG: hypothetical protein WBF90_30850 [Rivularia sp. (in: cyanobacteria)]